MRFKAFVRGMGKNGALCRIKSSLMHQNVRFFEPSHPNGACISLTDGSKGHEFFDKLRTNGCGQDASALSEVPTELVAGPQGWCNISSEPYA